MRGEGFEPANYLRTDLESVSVGHLDTLAKKAFTYWIWFLMKLSSVVGGELWMFFVIPLKSWIRFKIIKDW